MKNRSAEHRRRLQQDMRGSAPGKLILFGEHFVVHGSPAIALPLVQQRVVVRRWHGANTWRVPPGTDAHLRKLLDVLGETAQNLCFDVRSSLPMGAGLGSSAALSVALVRALGYRNPEKIQRMVHHLECFTHGRASGLDAAVCTLEQPLLFQRGSSPTLIKDVQVPRFFVATVPRSGSTQEAVTRVTALQAQAPLWFAKQLRYAEGIVLEGLSVLRKGHLAELGGLLSRAHALLRELGVSDPRHEKLIEASMRAGALGAKTTGAGLGGALIVLAAPEVDLSCTLQEAGAQSVLDCKIAAPPSAVGDGARSSAIG